MRKMYKKAKYKKHVRLELSKNALCGSPTSAPKLLIEQWRQLPPLGHCSICELVLTMHTETKVEPRRDADSARGF